MASQLSIDIYRQKSPDPPFSSLSDLADKILDGSLKELINFRGKFG